MKVTEAEKGMIDAVAQRLIDHPRHMSRGDGSLGAQVDYADEIRVLRNAEVAVHLPERRAGRELVAMLTRAADRLADIAQEISPNGDTGTIALWRDFARFRDSFDIIDAPEATFSASGARMGENWTGD